MVSPNKCKKKKKIRSSLKQYEPEDTRLKYNLLFSAHRHAGELLQSLRISINLVIRSMTLVLTQF